jgi:hypothetical protein
MYRAVAAADPTAIGQVFDAPNQQTRDLVSAFSELIIAGQHLQDAVRDTFSEDANAKPSARVPPAVNATDEARLANAEVQINGDSATVKTGPQQPPIALHQIDGQWRIDLARYAGGSTMPLDEQIEMNHSLATALAEAADEVTTGKYASAQEAESGVQQKIHAVIARELKNNPPTQPASQPTSQPASGKPNREN